MYFIVMLAVIGAITYLNWGLVHASPRSIAMFIPPIFCRVVGTGLLLFGMFSAIFSAYALHQVPGVIQGFIQGFAGLWFLLSATVGERGSYEDEQMLKRLFIMIGILEATILLVVFIREPRMLATISLGLVTGGFWVTTNFMSYLDRSR